MAARLEESAGGVIEFHVVGNSLSQKPNKKVLMWLVGLQNSVLRTSCRVCPRYITQLRLRPVSRARLCFHFPDVFCKMHSFF